MKPSIPSRLLIRSGDGTWTQTACRDIQEVRRIWSARADAANDVGILCSSLNDVAPGVFDSVAKRNPGRMLLSGGIKPCLPPSFETSAEPVATVDGTRLFVALRGFGNSIDDLEIEVGFSRADDDLEIPMEGLQDWLAAFARKNPDTADGLYRFEIRHEDSYLAGESELPEDLRRRLGVFRAYHLAGTRSTDPCVLANAAPPWLKQRKMSTLPFSTRTENVFKAKGIRTVDDLAGWSMAELLKAPNFGRKSLANVVQGLVAALEEGPTAGAKPSVQPEDWLAEFLRENPDTVDKLSGRGIQDERSYLARDLELQPDLRRRLGVFRAHHLIGNECEDPCELARAAPAWLQDRKFVSLSLPVRVEKCFLENNILSVKDLASWRSGELLGLSGFGRLSLRDVFRAIDGMLEEGPLQTAAGYETGTADGLLEQFRQFLARLPERERELLTRRLGFERESETLKQIGDYLGLTTERVRQIESKAIKKSRPPDDWRGMLERKMTAMRKERKQPLTISGMEKADLWFKGISSHRTFCENLVKTVFRGSIRVIDIDGVRYFGSMSQAEWRILVSSTAEALRASTGKRWSETALRDFVERRLPPEAREFAETLWTNLAPLCHFATNPGGERVFVGYGFTAPQLIRMILAESDRPLHLTKITEMAGNIERGRERKEHDAQTLQAAAASVGSLFGRGTYGLRKHLHLSEERAADIRDVAESIILSQPERQWHTSEILSELQRRSTGNGENLDKYKLDIVLAISKKLRALGRMTWVATDREQSRIDIRREAVAILEEAGRPLDAAEIRERLERKRGLNDHFGIQAAFPLVRLENGLWGINDRDVPVKRERQLELIDILVGRLEAKRRRIHVSELHVFLELDGCSARTFASIAAQDRRLKREGKSYLYLAKWGKPGRLSIKAALLQILNDAGEPPSLREAVERVEAIIGRKCNRQSIYNALRALRARSHW